MRIHRSIVSWAQGRTGSLAFGLALAACSSSSVGSLATPSESSAVAAAPSAKQAAKDPRVETWNKVIAKTPPPKDGCFHASYPSTTWIEVPCDPAPVGHASTAHPPRAKGRARAPELVSRPTGTVDVPGQGGGGGDWFLHESAPITQATGTFTSVIGATGSSSYSVQFNTNSFPIETSSDGLVAEVCPAGSCTGWQQVLYSSSVSQTGVYFQYWILSGGNCAYLELLDGWTSGGNGSCFFNSPSIPGVPLVSTNELSGMSVTVAAGSSDVLTMTIEGQAYASSFASMLGLNQGSWNQVEYGVFGDLGLRNVSLSPDTTITTEITAIPYTNTASCTLDDSEGGATGETNNLSDPSSGSGGTPSCCLAINSYESGIQFTETNTPGQACGVCGGAGQACCSTPTNGGCASGNVCYGGGCSACGGAGQLCCAGNTCTTPGDVCQAGLCGAPDGLSANPVNISAAQGDGSSLSVNHASTQITATGAWAGNSTPTFTFSGTPAGVICAGSNDLPPIVGPSTITCTTSPGTPLGTYPIVVNATIGSYTGSTTIYLTVTGCQPLSCSDAGYVCGSIDNGCGSTVSCGTCPSGESCTGGSCFACVERTCPVPEFFNLETCECQACPCGTIHVNGHYICAVCR